jgi:hypothetical protein
MTVTLVQSTGTHQTVSNLTVAYTSNVTSGNKIVVCAWKFDATSGFVAGDCTKSSGTATIGSITLDSSATYNAQRRAGVWSATVTGTGSLTIQVAIGSAGAISAGIAELSSTLGFISLSSANNNAATGAPGCGSLTSVGGAAFICAAQIQGGPVTITAGTNYTNIFEEEDQGSANYATGSSIYRIVSGLTTDSPTWSAPTTVQWAAAGVVYNEPAMPSPAHNLNQAKNRASNF